jgi:hypothetical protein
MNSYWRFLPGGASNQRDRGFIPRAAVGGHGVSSRERDIAETREKQGVLSRAFALTL